jgi:SAM-dependent methyltransferase
MPTDYKLYFKTLIPNIVHLEKYVRGSKYPNRHEDRIRLFKKLKGECDEPGKKCMQVGARGSKIGENWVSVDLYDKSPLIDYNYDIHDLQFENEIFDCVVCNAVLEHVEDPAKAISELFRVLKKSGKIWVEVPFNQPYHPTPGDFWRVTPEGIKIWMRQFKELSSGAFYLNNSLIYTGTYFFGEK